MNCCLSNYWSFFLVALLLAISACSDEESYSPEVGETTKTISFDLYAETGNKWVNNFAVSNDGEFVFYTSVNEVYRYHVATGEETVIVTTINPPSGLNSCYVHYIDGKLYVIHIDDNKSYVRVSSNNGDSFINHHVGTKLGSIDFEGPFWRVLFNRLLKLPDGSLIIPYLGDNIAVSNDDGASWSLKKSDIGFITANQQNKLFGMESTWTDEFGRQFPGEKATSNNVGTTWELYEDHLPTAVDRQSNLVTVRDNSIVKLTNGKLITYNWEAQKNIINTSSDYYTNSEINLNDVEFDQNNNLYLLNYDGNIYKTRLD
ncbi:hypothetical protein [Fulvivirga lutea]|uniref:Exo-alpha-sialidase n=1 Tax=Fulvivirga lutea TaxID=2810512 RepID=A0A974WHA7_9BACT|nr:hypothetical protein [Fulvivirga lutea]QSE97703.1 hypothetical protein JR347_01035 [Fulvivirga lutea]